MPPTNQRERIAALYRTILPPDSKWRIIGRCAYTEGSCGIVKVTFFRLGGPGYIGLAASFQSSTSPRRAEDQLTIMFDDVLSVPDGIPAGSRVIIDDGMRWVIGLETAYEAEPCDLECLREQIRGWIDLWIKPGPPVEMPIPR